MNTVHALLLIGFLLYCLQVFVVYDEAFKTSVYYIPTGMAITTLTGLSWLYIARSLDRQMLYFYGMVWDASILLAYYAVPLVFFSVTLSPLSAAGVGLVLLGIVLVKLGS